MEQETYSITHVGYCYLDGSLGPRNPALDKSGFATVEEARAFIHGARDHHQYREAFTIRDSQGNSVV